MYLNLLNWTKFGIARDVVRGRASSSEHIFFYKYSDALNIFASVVKKFRNIKINRLQNVAHMRAKREKNIYKKFAGNSLWKMRFDECHHLVS